MEAIKVEEVLQTEQSQEKLLQVSVLILSLDFRDMHLKLMWNLFWWVWWFHKFTLFNHSEVYIQENTTKSMKFGCGCEYQKRPSDSDIPIYKHFEMILVWK